jgi:hypothetical protein
MSGRIIPDLRVSILFGAFIVELFLGDCITCDD